MPYNYLVDPVVRASLPSIPWENAVVVIDEAHNVESVCSDSASFELPAEVLAACIDECDHCVMHLNESLKDNGGAMSEDGLTADNMVELKELLLHIESSIDSLPLSMSKSDGLTKGGSYLYELLQHLCATRAAVERRWAWTEGGTARGRRGRIVLGSPYPVPKGEDARRLGTRSSKTKTRRLGSTRRVHAFAHPPSLAPRPLAS